MEAPTFKPTNSLTEKSLCFDASQCASERKSDFRTDQQKMALGVLFFLIIKLHLVTSATHFHGYEVLIIFVGLAWLCLRKCNSCVHESKQIPTTIPSSSKLSGSARSLPNRSMRGFGSPTLSSRTITYTGSAKTFTLNDIEKATNNFDASRILGEGGFGPVYKGVLCDGRDVAVKILKRDDRHGGREFLAEVEMLSRLHHKNAEFHRLLKLRKMENRKNSSFQILL
ncbi:hypothetical protein K1719_007151 [Acacia pycnantha]|nr:hypothetical protein K1719_007151 [Acacia pycnantha]